MSMQKTTLWNSLKLHAGISEACWKIVGEFGRLFDLCFERS